MARTSPRPITTNCTNTFKNGNSPPSREEYTKLWIHLINQMEKNKNYETKNVTS